jgi:hypothetical protein
MEYIIIIYREKMFTIVKKGAIYITDGVYVKSNSADLSAEARSSKGWVGPTRSLLHKILAGWKNDNSWSGRGGSTDQMQHTVNVVCTRMAESDTEAKDAIRKIREQNGGQWNTATANEVFKYALNGGMSDDLEAGVEIQRG